MSSNTSTDDRQARSQNPDPHRHCNSYLDLELQNPRGHDVRVTLGTDSVRGETVLAVTEAHPEVDQCQTAAVAALRNRPHRLLATLGSYTERPSESVTFAGMGPGGAVIDVTLRPAETSPRHCQLVIEVAPFPPDDSDFHTLFDGEIACSAEVVSELIAANSPPQ